MTQLPIKLLGVSRIGFARKHRGWFTVRQSPTHYRSLWSGMVHSVRFAESVVNKEGEVDRVVVAFWCGGTGSVSSFRSLQTKGEWTDPETHPALHVCKRCIEAEQRSTHPRTRTRNKKTP